jgi:hypothetical protein
MDRSKRPTSLHCLTQASLNRYANVALLLGAIVLIVARAPWLLIHPRIWAEEGIFLTYALHHPALQTLLHLHRDSGYYLLSADLPALWSAFVAKKFGLEYAPFVSTYFSLCLQILPFIILIFGKSHLFRTRAMVLTGGLIILLAPSTSGELWLNTINSMSWIGLAALIILFEDTTEWSKRKRLVFRIILVFFGLCGPYAAITFPLFACSYLIYRERERLIQTGILFTCCLLQLGIFAFVRQSGGASSRLGALTWDSAIVNSFYFFVVGAFGGQRGANSVFDRLGLTDSLHKSLAVPRGGPVILAAYFCALVMILLLVGLWNKRLRAQDTLLISTFIFFAVFTAGAAANGVPLSRYTFFPGLAFLLLVWFAAWNHRYIMTRIVCIFMVICALWYGMRDYQAFWIAYGAPALAPAWSDEVKKWRSDNSYQLRVWPPFFSPVVAWDSRVSSRGDR